MSGTHDDRAAAALVTLAFAGGTAAAAVAVLLWTAALAAAQLRAATVADLAAVAAADTSPLAGGHGDPQAAAAGVAAANGMELAAIDLAAWPVAVTVQVRGATTSPWWRPPTATAAAALAPPDLTYPSGRSSTSPLLATAHPAPAPRPPCGRAPGCPQPGQHRAHDPRAPPARRARRRPDALPP